MENKFLTKFDSVKSKFINNLKDDIFKQEIETFTKYNIIDENNMFNYIYMHNYYKKLLDDPFVYKINIISNNNEQIKSLLSLLFKEPIENLNLNKQSIYQTYINFNDKSQKNLFDSYIIKDNEKKLLIENKPIKEIFDHINVEENSEILITPNDFKFNIYPSIIFKFYIDENIEKDIIPIINKNLEKEYIEKNENLKLFEKDILNQYFNNKNTLYLNEQIYHRTTSILSALNIFLYNKDEWEKNKESIINNIKYKNDEKLKDILINNIICNFNENKLYYIDKEKEKDLFNSNTSYDDENNYNLNDNIYKIIYNHFKNEMNFAKTYLINYNSLINDHLKITFNKTDPLKSNDDIINFFKNNIKSSIETEVENYNKERESIFQDIISIPKNTLLENLSNIKQEIDSKYFITNNTFEYLHSEINNYLSNFQSEILSYITQLDNLNINIFYNLKKILNEQGIYSLNFDGLIKIIAVERISIQDPIQNLLQKNKNTFAQILASFGISGVVGGASSFITGRALTTVGASATAGTFGGPIGIGVGVVLGVGTLFAQARSHFKGNRGHINNLLEEINNNIRKTVDNVEESINKEMEKIRDTMEKDINEIKKVMDIIVDRAIKLLSE
jgi:hypothetical protein